MKKGTKYYVADFETTVFNGQRRTDVWAAALVSMDAPDDPSYVEVFSSIDDFMKRILSGGKQVIYFHNLKFDGSFIMSWLLSNKKFKPWGDYIGGKLVFRDDPWKMDNGHFMYSISSRGMWYSIRIKTSRATVEIRDSLKLLPFSVKKIGADFKTKHRKLELEYEGSRVPGGYLTKEEQEYIKNDVLVVKEALRFMFEQGHNKLTIGSCCMTEFRNIFTGFFSNWDSFFPNLYNADRYSVPDFLMEPLQDEYGSGAERYKTPGDFLRLSYKGGWCYTVPDRIGKVFKPIDKERMIAGTTADVNSLYPSMMHSMSGNYYPIGEPSYFEGEIPEILNDHTKYYYFVCFRANWKIKPGYLPTVQIKGEPLKYPGREWLLSSEITDRKTGERTDYAPLLVMTQSDFKTFKEHYNIENLKIYGGVYFKSILGIFDEYIDKYKKIKQESKGALRQLAKLFLNNLYGKFASSTESSYKVLSIGEDGSIVMGVVEEHTKTPGYIPIGSAITSYARCFTIKAAQANYNPGGRGFIYSDTDSIHCDLLPEEIKGAPEHPTEFCHWKYESNWSEGFFMGAKRYAEKHSYEDGERLPAEKWDLKCAGMSDHCKDLFIGSIEQSAEKIKALEKKKEEKEKAGLPVDTIEKELAFIKTKRDITDFKEGLVVPGMLKARQIPGGVLLEDCDYTMRPVNKWI